MIGEQPGDREDISGRPFVGPARQLLDRALQEVGFDRAQVYVTNTVKHPKWEPRGERRILRATGDETRQRKMQRFITDLKRVNQVLRKEIRQQPAVRQG